MSADYFAMAAEPEASTRTPLAKRVLYFALVSFAFIGFVSVAALATIGASTLATIGASTTLSAVAPTTTTLATAGESTPALPTVGGECKCTSSQGSSCCCCSHCGCGVNAPPQEVAPASGVNQSGSHQNANWGGNWDIDVGGSGVAGGGFCQCNGQCCCCSSCDCTGPGISMKNTTIHGNCVGVGNCNGDLPARRKLLLSHQVRRRLAMNLERARR